jgi:hypothetical protein
MNKKAHISIPGWRVAHSGGNVNNGDNAGFAALNANNDSSNRNTNVGGRECSFAPDMYALAHAKRKNKAHKVLVDTRTLRAMKQTS